jgi:hypothetical protein
MINSNARPTSTDLERTDIHYQPQTPCQIFIEHQRLSSRDSYESIQEVLFEQFFQRGQVDGLVPWVRGG